MKFLSLLPLASFFSLAASQEDHPIDVTPLNYKDGDFDLMGYVSLPAVTPAPAIVIIPDWDNVNAYEQQRATKIATELGYVGFAADIYGVDFHDGVPDMAVRREQAGLYRGNPELFIGRMNAAIEAAKALDEVDGKVGMIGYCFGGTGIIQYSLLGGSDADALVSFHGGLSAVPTESNATAGPKIMIQSGGDDDTSTRIMDLEMTLDSVNATWEISRYSGVQHAFTNWDDDRYNKNADTRSWEEMTSFFAEEFGEKVLMTNQPSGLSVEAVEYTDVDGHELTGYLAIPDEDEWSLPAAAVVIIPDW